MPKRRVAIIGGGVAGLTAAFYLQRTPELRARFDVTVHQLGFRLGGKVASSRNRDQHLRNEEHGLHVWFGFYENAFGTLRQVYERIDRSQGFPYATVYDAFSPQGFTPIGKRRGAHWDFIPVHWPAGSGRPGDGVFEGGAERAVSVLLGSVRASLHTLLDAVLAEPGRPLLQRKIGKALHAAIAALPVQAKRVAAMPHASGPVSRLLSLAKTPAGRRGWHVLESFLGPFRQLGQWLLDALLDRDSSPNAQDLLSFFEVALAALHGLTNPAYGVIEHGWDLDRLNHLEFRQWLVDNGASRDVAYGWSGIEALYQTGFFYDVDARGARQNLEAGTALRILIRIVATYEGAVLYLPKAGLGELYAGPLFKLLQQYGVKFEFFHKLTGVGMSQDGKRLDRLHFERQAHTKGGAPYRPEFLHAGLWCWPSEPDWDQLQDGDALRDAGVDFESHWTTHRGVQETLALGDDFDHVVLATALGSLKPLNAHDGSPVDALLSASPVLRRAVDTLPVVPTLATQLWFNDTLGGLGWILDRPAYVGFSEPLDIWADMSPVIASEAFPAPRPGSLGYLCGVMDTTLHLRPSSDSGVPAEAAQVVEDRVRRQLDRWGGALWSNAWSSMTGFDWDALYDARGQRGLSRLGAQYLRANIDPAHTCVGSPVGAARVRPTADGLRVDNVTLAGAWVRTGLNAESVEAATMSGMAAARAVSGEPLAIYGEYFMASKPKGG